MNIPMFAVEKTKRGQKWLFVTEFSEYNLVLQDLKRNECTYIRYGKHILLPKFLFLLIDFIGARRDTVWDILIWPEINFSSPTKVQLDKSTNFVNKD